MARAAELIVALAAWAATALALQVDLDSPSPAAEVEDWPFQRSRPSFAKKRPGDSARKQRKMATATDTRRQLMINQGDVEYVSHMQIGGQTVAGILDTGSFELVVFSTECENCGIAAKYNPKVSRSHTTGGLMTMQSYGSGDTYSWEAADLVRIGPFAAKNQTFWEVVDAKMPILQSASFEAIIGLGPPETPAADSWAEVQTALNTINRYYDEGKRPTARVAQTVKDAIDAAEEMSKSGTMLDTFDVKTFSLCMGARPGSDGVITWQDESPFLHPEIFTRLPVLGNHTWSVALSNVRMTRPGPFPEIKLDCHRGKQCSALLDSGTSLLAVPQEIIELITRKVASLNSDCDFSHLPSLTFVLGGKMVSLPPDAYIAEASGNVPANMRSFVRIREISGGGDREKGKKCKVMLMESYIDSESGPMWILGMPFFRKYYTTFHVGSPKADRAVYVAEANDDCYPQEGGSLVRTRSFRRHIDVSRLHAPPLLRGGAGLPRGRNVTRRVMQSASA